MEFTITKEQIERLIKMAEHGSTNVIKADLKNWFPKAFKKELIVGKWYKNTLFNYIFCFNGQYEDNSQYGFAGCGKWVTDASSAKRHLDNFDLATDEEVEDALKAEAKKRGFVDGSKFKSSLSENGKIRTVKEDGAWDFYMLYNTLNISTPENEWGDAQSNPTIFKDGKWAEIIPEEKTTISKEKALKIIAKKLKVSPENIEIK